MGFSALPGGVGGTPLAELASCTAQATAPAHCGCEGFSLLGLVWFFCLVGYFVVVLKHRVLSVFNVFLKSLQRGCFQLMGCSKSSPPARKASLKDLPRAVESDVPREPGTGFSGA